MTTNKLVHNYYLKVAHYGIAELLTPAFQRLIDTVIVKEDSGDEIDKFKSNILSLQTKLTKEESYLETLYNKFKSYISNITHFESYVDILNYINNLVYTNNNLNFNDVVTPQELFKYNLICLLRSLWSDYIYLFMNHGVPQYVRLANVAKLTRVIKKKIRHSTEILFLQSFLISNRKERMYNKLTVDGKVIYVPGDQINKILKQLKGESYKEFIPEPSMSVDEVEKVINKKASSNKDIGTEKPYKHEDIVKQQPYREQIQQPYREERQQPYREERQPPYRYGVETEKRNSPQERRQIEYERFY